MTADLKEGIENLYTTFSIYPFKPKMEGCPCCVSNGDKEKLHSKQLRELDGEDLSRYAFKAMTTWGDVDDFKHYMPRIFELVVTTDFIVDTSVTLGKLDYGKWKNWPGTEKKAVSQFLYAWWSDLIKHKSYFDNEAFCTIYKLTGDIELLLNHWTFSFTDNSFLNFVDLIYEYYSDLMGRRKNFREMDDSSIEKILQWLKKNSGLLEKGFFKYADKDNELAAKISTSQSLLERT